MGKIMTAKAYIEADIRLEDLERRVKELEKK